MSINGKEQFVLPALSRGNTKSCFRLYLIFNRCGPTLAERVAVATLVRPRDMSKQDS